jgi:hypothetical protein
MGNFVLQIGPCSSLILRISPWGIPFPLLLCFFSLAPILFLSHRRQQHPSASFLPPSPSVLLPIDFLLQSRAVASLSLSPPPRGTTGWLQARRGRSGSIIARGARQAAANRAVGERPTRAGSSGQRQRLGERECERTQAHSACAGRRLGAGAGGWRQRLGPGRRRTAAATGTRAGGTERRRLQAARVSGQA